MNGPRSSCTPIYERVQTVQYSIVQVRELVVTPCNRFPGQRATQTQEKRRRRTRQNKEQSVGLKVTMTRVMASSWNLSITFNCNVEQERKKRARLSRSLAGQLIST